MHIVLFHYTFNNLAGTERVLVNLIEFLCNEGYKVSLLLAGPPSVLAFDITQYPVKIMHLSIDLRKLDRGFLSNAFVHLRLMRAVKTYLKGQDNTPMVVIATNPLLASVSYVSGKLARKKLQIISCEHFALSASGVVAQQIRKWFYPKMYVVALTEKDRETIVEKFRPRNAFSIANASPFPPSEYRYDPKRKTILSIGRLSYQKGFDMLLTAFATFSRSVEGWKLIIVGDDYGDKSLLQAQAAALQLQNVEFVAATKDIQQYYRAATFYVMSSRFEGMPMVLLEAMSFGLPIISFDCPTGPAELITKEAGILVKAEDTKELASAAIQLATDSSLLLSKAKGATARAMQFSKDLIKNQWLSLLLSIQSDLKN